MGVLAETFKSAGVKDRGPGWFMPRKFQEIEKEIETESWKATVCHIQS